MNRLTSASDSGGWSRGFGYDQFGNMWLTANSGVPLAGNTPTSNIYNPANNQMNGQTYDSAGNMLSLNGNAALYDAENRLISVTEAPAFGGGVEAFTYDADGRRVQKTDGGETTVYVYDVFGRLAAEYSDDAPTPPPCQTCYLSYDHLGSIRLVTDQSANIIARHDYLPFGEEIPSGSAGRISQNGYGATDYVSQRFTGQICDSETGLDFFHARYLGAALGRFTSVDPDFSSACAYHPQRWNRYAYVSGNPLHAIDLTGKDEMLSMGYLPPPPPSDPGDALDPSSIIQFLWDAANASSSWAGGSGMDPTAGAVLVVEDPTPLKVTNFSNSGPNQDAISKVLQKIADQLPSSTDCANWLQGGGVTASDLIPALISNNSFGHGQFSDNTIAAFAGSTLNGAPVGVPVSAALTVNDNGAFFNSNYTVGPRNYQGGTLRAQAAILIHELAHIIGAAGFQSDFGNSAAEKNNNKLVNQNCGKLIRSLQ